MIIPEGKIKKYVLAAVILAAVAAGGILTRQYFGIPKGNETVVCTQDAKSCSDGSYVARIPPGCEFASCPGEKEGILVSDPQTNHKIKSPLVVKGQARGFWYFEAQFFAELLDADGNLLGMAVLTSQEDWMTENFVPFEGELTFAAPKTPSGILRFLSDNPSGLPENQKIFDVPVQFENVINRKILLYYYNPEQDKSEDGNTMCSRAGLVPVERDIPFSQTPVQDAIRLLIEGALTPEETAAGITTEYPLEGFKLLDANLTDETLTLRFEDPINKTTGGSCRVGILWFQIEATTKQFPQVQQVRFLPEELFQP